MAKQKKKRTHAWYKYEVGGENSRKEKITKIVDSTSKAAIYYVEGRKSFTWEYDPNTCPTAEEASSVAKAILTRVFSSVPERKQEEALGLAATGLSLALNLGVPKSKINYFLEAEAFVDSVVIEAVHLKYVATAILATVLFFFPPVLYLLVYSKDGVYHILVGSFFGAIGALVSLLQRFSAIKIPKYSSWWYTALRGATRIFIGSIFAAIFVILQKAGMIANLLNSSSFLIYALSFASGLSERYVPELLHKVQPQFGDSQKKDSESDAKD